MTHSVLVLDDRVDDRTLMRAILERAGYAVIEAATGPEALAIVEARHPDLVITDLVMPTMNGYEFVRRLRDLPVGASTPVIFCTGTYLEAEVQHLAAACGVERFLSKPIDFELVIVAVRDTLTAAVDRGPGRVDAADGPEFEAEQVALLNDKLVEKALALEDLSSEHQKLIGQLLHAHEEERDRIANDLHDDAIQALAAVKMRLDTVSSRLSSSDEAAMVAALGETVGSAIERLRGVLAGLQSVELVRRPLSDALAIFIERLQRDTELEVSLQNEIHHEPEPLTRTLLYRTTLEILMNVRKHAEASWVKVLLSERTDCYEVTVRDDGRGFSVAEAMRVRAGHVGLPSIRARLELLGGSLQIESRPGQGTTVELRVPRAIHERPGVTLAE